MFKTVLPGFRDGNIRFAIPAEVAGMIDEMTIGIGTLKVPPSKSQVPGIIDMPGKLTKYRLLFPISAAFLIPM